MDRRRRSGEHEISSRREPTVNLPGTILANCPANEPIDGGTACYVPQATARVADGAATNPMATVDFAAVGAATGDYDPTAAPFLTPPNVR